MRDLIYLRGSGGGVFAYTPPLHPEILKQFNARKLTQVNADGSAYEGVPWAPEDPETGDEDDDTEDAGAASKAPSKVAAKGA